ncbi:MAG: Mut7-C RNAse domain-containing protein [Candidatus Micrarchaeia archaeon]
MRLVADIMLAKLARWLRLGGVSIESAPYVSDDKLIKYVKKRRALLLTLDEALAERSKKQGFRVLLVKGSGIVEQLAYVSGVLGLSLSEKPSGICPYCNARLVKVEKKKVLERLPERVAKEHRIFYLCRNCNRIYWQGSHWKDISKKLRLAKSLSKRYSAKK